MKKIIFILITLSLIFTGCKENKDSMNSQTEETTVIQTESATQQNTEATIEETAIHFLTDLSNQEYDQAIENYPITDKLAAAVNESYLQNDFWGQFLAAYGDFKEMGSATARKEQGFDVIGVDVKFEKAIVTLNVVFDSEHAIAGFNCSNVVGTE